MNRSQNKYLMNLCVYYTNFDYIIVVEILFFLFVFDAT